VSNWKECWLQSSAINMDKVMMRCSYTSTMKCRDFWIQTDLQRPISKHWMKKSSLKSTLERRKMRFSLRGRAMRMQRAEFPSAQRLQPHERPRRTRSPRLARLLLAHQSGLNHSTIGCRRPKR
jgi:hypothetical protein